MEISFLISVLYRTLVFITLNGKTKMRKKCGKNDPNFKIPSLLEATPRVT